MTRTVPYKMRSALTLTGLLLALATAAPAAAQSPDDQTPADIPTTELTVGALIADAQAMNFSVPVSCVVPTGTSGACLLTVTVSWQRTPKAKWAPSGPTTVVDQQQLSIPTGQTQTIASTVAPAKLRDILSAEDGAAIVRFDFSDPTGDVGAAAVFVRPPSRKGGCGGAAFMKVLSGTLDEERRNGDKEEWAALRSPQIARGLDYRVTSKSARIRYSGITVTAAKGTVFGVGCGALSDYGHGRFFPLVQLKAGRVRLQGRPRGKATYAAAVDTLEGNLGMRRREKVDMTVTRNAHRFVSTMRVRKGRSGQITPTFHTAQSSPCTKGSKLSVNLRGRIRRVR